MASLIWKCFERCWAHRSHQFLEWFSGIWWDCNPQFGWTSFLFHNTFFWSRTAWLPVGIQSQIPPKPRSKIAQTASADEDVAWRERVERWKGHERIEISSAFQQTSQEPQRHHTTSAPKGRETLQVYGMLFFCWILSKPGVMRRKQGALDDVFHCWISV